MYSETMRDNMIELCKYHLDKHPDKQIKQTIQELGELIVELTKYQKPLVHDGLMEEIFDVDFMIMQLKQLLIIRKGKGMKYKKIAHDKIGRELERYGLLY